MYYTIKIEGKPFTIKYWEQKLLGQMMHCMLWENENVIGYTFKECEDNMKDVIKRYVKEYGMPIQADMQSL